MNQNKEVDMHAISEYPSSLSMTANDEGFALEDFRCSYSSSLAFRVYQLQVLSKLIKALLSLSLKRDSNS